MYGKKQRIISFLMAFLLIFTFAFINPLTVSQSQAFAFVPVLTTNMARIITGILISAGYIIHETTTPTLDIDLSLTNLADTIYRTLNDEQKEQLENLSIESEKVNVPVNLYDSVVENTDKIIGGEQYSQSLIEQNIYPETITLKSSSESLPDVTIPVYVNKRGTNLPRGNFSEKQIDLTEAIPFLEYTGIENPPSNKLYREGVTSFALSFSEDIPLYENGSIQTLTPDLSSYNNSFVRYLFFPDTTASQGLSVYSTTGSGQSVVGVQSGTVFGDINNRFIIKFYILLPQSTSDTTGAGAVMEMYDKTTGNFVNQSILNNYTFLHRLFVENLNTSISSDLSITVESDPTVTIPNEMNDGYILTLPSDLAGSIGITSTDVNVGSTDVPDNPSSETIGNINTNIGELVTGGTLGEQVNTNIGTVEGLHGELTEQVDFGAVFDTIAQYISSLDISSVTWFPVAVASFLVPFLPVISLGLILFFIDRVLNGGA